MLGEMDEECEQIVLPVSERKLVLELAHDKGGHCSETVTTLLELELLHCVTLLLFLIRFTCFSLVSRNSHQ